MWWPRHTLKSVAKSLVEHLLISRENDASMGILSHAPTPEALYSSIQEPIIAVKAQFLAQSNINQDSDFLLELLEESLESVISSFATRSGDKPLHSQTEFDYIATCSAGTLAPIVDLIARMFGALTPPGTEIATRLSIIRGDSYHAIATGGVYQAAMRADEVPMHTTSNPIQRLLEANREGVKIILTGQREKERWWQPMPNDVFQTNMACLLAGVPPREHASGVNFPFAWILFVGADRANVFTVEHMRLADSIVRLFTVLRNAIIHSSANHPRFLPPQERGSGQPNHF